MTWKDYPIFKRDDDSFVIVVDEAPYHVPNEGEWAELYTEVAEYYAANENCRSDHEIDYMELHPELQPEPEPEPTPEEQEAALKKQYTRMIQRHLDETAYALGYTGANEDIVGACNSVCTYMDTGVQKFDDEGDAFRKWRSAVWAKGYELLAEVQAGTRPIPTEEELIELLPKLEIVYSDEQTETNPDSV